MPAEGFEPPTYGLQNRCTTTVLSRQIMTYGALISCHSVRESPPLPFILPKAGCRSAYHPSKERVRPMALQNNAPSMFALKRQISNWNLWDFNCEQ